MMTRRVGILHPGAMGASVAATARNSGCDVRWLPEGRSTATCERAERLGFGPEESLRSMASRCEVIISVCPPHAAEDVAESLIPEGFRGVFVEANAISPQRARRMDATMSAAGIRFVDGGILGLPAWEPGSTCLYLSGPESAEIANLFAAGPLEARCLEGQVGQASALKMCYAGHTKGTRALLSAVLAAADALDVRAALETHWAGEDANFPSEVRRKVLATSPKAWRWVGEMREIADTFESADLPTGFHEAAQDIYERLVDFRDAEVPSIEDFLKALRSSGPGR
jgi:3-hydroxyisobutyrate dehydrogenase-like beta-hydroxyacid dehydrogenase